MEKLKSAIIEEFVETVQLMVWKLKKEELTENRRSWYLGQISAYQFTLKAMGMPEEEVESIRSKAWNEEWNR